MTPGMQASHSTIPANTDTDGRTQSSARRSLIRAVSPTNISALYLLFIAIVIFSLTAPKTFPEWDTVQQVADGNAVTALAALGLVVPLSAGVFDISTSYNMALSGIVAAYLLVHTSWPLSFVIFFTLLVSIAVGVANGFVVVILRIDSLIGTLATGALIAAVISLISGGNTIIGPRLAGSYAQLSQRSYFGLTLPVFYSLALAAVIWFLMDHTASGRRIYATGFNPEASRLAGVQTSRIRFLSLVFSGSMAGIAGIVLGSTIGSGSPSAGLPYLLPVFAAVFLGATQFKRGRFNSWGTLLAVVLLGVGITGLGLAGAAPWAGNLFTGVALIAALAVTGAERRWSVVALRQRMHQWRSLRRPAN